MGHDIKEDQTSGVLISANVPNQVYQLTEETSPQGADVLLGEDSANSWSKIKIPVSTVGGGASWSQPPVYMYQRKGSSTETTLATGPTTVDTLRITLDDDPKPFSIRMVCGIWTDGADTANCDFDVVGYLASSSAITSNLSETIFEVFCVTTTLPTLTPITINIRLWTGSGIANANLRWRQILARQ